MENIEKYYELVENIIRSFGIDPAISRGDNPGQWNLQKGSAPVWIDVFKNEQGAGYFQVMSPICSIPQNNQLEFYKEILEINHNLFGVGMTKYEDGIYLKVIRELDGLVENEIKEMFNRIGYYADQYDDYFKNKYFGD